MKRRQVLKWLAATGAASLGAGLDPSVMPTRRLTRRFFVAGARYHKVAVPPEAGDDVFLERTVWRTEPSLAIVTAAGHRIGFVPRSMVPEIASLRAPKLFLSEANLDAVPWKRYRVALTADL
jgi:hypothetical protein